MNYGASWYRAIAPQRRAPASTLARVGRSWMEACGRLQRPGLDTNAPNTPRGAALLCSRVYVSLCVRSIASYLACFARRPRHGILNHNNLVWTFDKPLVYAWMIPGCKYWKSSSGYGQAMSTLHAKSRESTCKLRKSKAL